MVGLAVRCISLWQPWASLCFLGKRDETRHWATTYRGPLAIHASQKWGSDVAWLCTDAPFAQALAPLTHRPVPRGKVGQVPATPADLSAGPLRLPLGCIIGSVILVACRRTRDVVEKRTPTELAFGDYSDGRYAWEFEDPRLLPEPVPYRGQQGMFDVPCDLLGR